MEHHVGIDVSLELSSLCVLDVTGKDIREAKVASEPEAWPCHRSRSTPQPPKARAGASTLECETETTSRWIADRLHFVRRHATGRHHGRTDRRQALRAGGIRGLAQMRRCSALW